MSKKLRKGLIINAIQFTLIFLLVIIVLLIIASIEDIQGNSRVVNYTGIVRGSTQRLVKLELSMNQNNSLIDYIDRILDNLHTGGGEYQVNRLTDELYLTKLNQLSTSWDQLKQAIYQFRLGDIDQSVLLSLSEDIYDLANDTVNIAEIHTDGEARRLKFLEFALIIIITLVLLLVVTQIVSVFITNRKNKELSMMANIDGNTGLPNKACCDHIIHENKHNLGMQYACIMFDLNNLKQTNDNYGHTAGDDLIYNFASILLSLATENVFVGRYGGDEFIAILSNTTEDEVKALLQNIDVKINYFNNGKFDVPISCAWGYEISSANESFSLQTLLIKADKNMYRNKALMKSQPINEIH